MYRVKPKGKYELKLGEIRKARGMTQSELAALLGVTKQIVNRRSRVRIAQEAPETPGRWLAVYLFC